jgi:hypothetical protein
MLVGQSPEPCMSTICGEFLLRPRLWAPSEEGYAPKFSAVSVKLFQKSIATPKGRVGSAGTLQGRLEGDAGVGQDENGDALPARENERRTRLCTTWGRETLSLVRFTRLTTEAPVFESLFVLRASAATSYSRAIIIHGSQIGKEERPMFGQQRQAFAVCNIEQYSAPGPPRSAISHCNGMRPQVTELFLQRVPADEHYS